MALEFKTVAKPVIKRVENPFIDVVAGVEPGTEKALSFSMPNKTAEEKKAIRIALRQLTEAGTENNVTVRRNIVESKDETEITFWTVPKIVHGGKSDSGDELEKEIEEEVKAEVKKALAKKG